MKEKTDKQALPRVLTIGDTNVDIIMDVGIYPSEGSDRVLDTWQLRLGGSACNTAVVLAKLGVLSSLLSFVGTDDFGDKVFRELSQIPVDETSLRRIEGSTGLMVSLISSDGQRTIVGCRGVNSTAFSCEETVAQLPNYDHIHVSGYTFLVNEQWKSIMEIIRQANSMSIPVSLDPGLEPILRVKQRITEVLPHITMVFPNRLETEAYSGSNNQDQGAREMIEHGAKLVVQKLGSAGCKLYSAKEKTMIRQLCVNDVCNTTGAGDAFDGAFLFSYLSGSSLETAGAFANVVAWLVISAEEGIPGLPKGQQLLDSVSSIEVLTDLGLSEEFSDGFFKKMNE